MNKKKKKWIKATNENVRKLGYPWGAPIGARVRNNKDHEWKIVNLSSIVDAKLHATYRFRVDGNVDFISYKYCQIRNKKYKAAKYEW